jgi:hypothetical protein
MIIELFLTDQNLSFRRRRKGVQEYGMVDKDTLRGTERRHRQTRDTATRRHSLGDFKEDPTAS